LLQTPMSDKRLAQPLSPKGFKDYEVERAQIQAE
jgi:hypothetical protein